MDYSGCQFDQYLLNRLIGSGGYADVYEAWDLNLARPVAIKVLHEQLTRREEAAFRREAQIMARMDHPNIVRVLEFDVVDEGIPFLVMSYIPNGSLRQHHSAGESLPAKTVMRYVLQIANALEYIHNQGFVHQDIKPENLLLDDSDGVLLADFGIMSLKRNIGNRGDPEVVGTASYLAPERLYGEATPASDQYSLAVIVYEWLTGEPLFSGSTNTILQHHLNTPPSTRMRGSGIPAAIQQVLVRALAKDPGERFSSIQEFAQALDQALYEETEGKWQRMSLVFASTLLTSILCGLGLYGAGLNYQGIQFVVTLCLVFFSLLISLFCKSGLSLKINLVDLAVSTLLGLVFHSFPAFGLALLILQALCTLVACTISLVQFFRRH